MLFTRCPDCDTTFRVTDDALKKANGQVRCGRCASVFNAYAERREAPGERDRRRVFTTSARGRTGGARQGASASAAESRRDADRTRRLRRNRSRPRPACTAAAPAPNPPIRSVGAEPARRAREHRTSNRMRTHSARFRSPPCRAARAGRHRRRTPDADELADLDASAGSRRCRRRRSRPCSKPSRSAIGDTCPKSLRSATAGGPWASP